ncbi:MAG: hypothetical protein E6Q97_38975 [Desulfurellales bacterium]|nr:MAG: hypothetical protein E6Q97_38975 [Desulfurellales bacterium]
MAQEKEVTPHKYAILGSEMRRDKSGHTYRVLLCKCPCGDTSWRRATHVLSGRSRSCRSCSNKTHGHSHAHEYNVWYSMVHRCTAPESQFYDRYGGRGITVCERWLQYDAFLEDMGRCPTGLTLERVNNDLGYSKENCVWATRAEQNANRSNSRMLTAFGKRQHMAAWCREYGIRQDTLAYRLRNCWPLETALTEPVQNGKARG